MKLVLVWVGRTHDSRLQALQRDYLGRLEKFTGVEARVVRESPRRESSLAQAEEKRWLEEKIPAASILVALDETGRQYSSREFARFLETLSATGRRSVTFVVGGVHGLSREFTARADYVLSLSPMTWTHEMTRVLLLEQLYRAFSISRGYPYHK
ncbi:MAG TPA: 23S rRNA (pseudouridine(1915)-N(3))-methyltransferase RlmH [Acidobacteriota bacterium]|jgi:23S rRNA (pseudouridine1915-N3)-methyltransferase